MEERAGIPVGPPVTDPLPSYWHNPKSPFANVIEPETDTSTEPYDFAIIGSGISGTMIAHFLLKSQPHARIVMLEAREICSGATGRNGGHTKAASYRSYMQHVQELGKEEALKIARLEYANITETHRLAEEMGINCESMLCNTVDVIYDHTTFDLGKAAIQALRADATEEERDKGKMAWYQVYEKNEDLERRFFIASKNGNAEVAEKEDLAGVFKYLAGRIHAYRFTTGVLKGCVENGLQLCTSTPVHNIRTSPKGTDDERPMWDVFTQYNTITARSVILATNGYTPYLMKDLQGAIVPMRGQITAQQPGKASKLTSPLPTTYSFIYRDGYEYMIPRSLPNGEQHIIIGGGLCRLPHAGASEYGTVNDSSLNSQISKYLHESLTGYFGADNWGETSDEEISGRVVQEWTGIMGATADGRPFVGEVPYKKGMWISAGFNGHGMVLCLKSAEALAGMIDQGSFHEKPDWFPESFLITEERLKKCSFRGRTDMRVPI
ncbi:FAD dependent oxidoreductase-like protein [Cucurbitaria berberidis CBS 394.84]|uniref:FAD dependent oxidoreductase-like protein n=1 Tax=Cucurbitaria berberidis CBS 394.84 TaxID=1168544 RepID=A0A9P4L8W5_9PLEO|nr:FAD dependent oxidoreductase-like protein [Cucurbitaria berberidis CBS 394.84]KAF1846470.1 FAD dependent oxidoreductase-like protein [Cucurbitaria berberidis CBS 394.84]